ncbi:unnamed protein product [Paramecium octaurelia]|uniref:Uncharacterized protein n=1 Tax=Paramecium octaurelia TaxID=43137 RepID=A0A8S1YAR4_PAROT|nr:unnamed protein product [Paramecium octaurelia]
MGITCSQPKKATLTLTTTQDEEDPNYEIKKLLKKHFHVPQKPMNPISLVKLIMITQ